MNKIKNILSFFLQLLVLPVAAYLLFSLWTEQELGIIFYQNACFLFMLCYVIRKPVLNRTFKPEGRFEYWAAFITFYCVSFYILGLTLSFSEVAGKPSAGGCRKSGTEALFPLPAKITVQAQKIRSCQNAAPA